MNSKLKILVVLASLVACIAGHGMLMDPVNRLSRWRVDNSYPREYTDNQGFCGGYAVQWQNNGGRCGLCGDPYQDSAPRRAELGGDFGQGVIVKTYKKGQVIETSNRITANHYGFISWQLCNLDVKIESEDCFSQYQLATTSGEINWTIPTSTGDFKVQLQLPSKLVCNHCVLRWTYTAGNNWGICPDGRGKLGCGSQETFKSCSDIRITN